MILASETLGTIFITIIAFLIVSLLLISVLLYVKQKLSPSGPVMITINGEKEIEVASGETLLTTLGAQKIFLPFLTNHFSHNWTDNKKISTKQTTEYNRRE